MSSSEQRSQQQRIVIVGGTSAIAEHCARLWLANASASLVLIGRSAERLRRVAADLAVRSPASCIECFAIDFVDPAAIAHAVAAVCTERMPDIVLIAHGSLPDQVACQVDLQAGHDAMVINGISPALFAQAFVERMMGGGPARLILIGSVAGDRGRQSNYIYGAAKGMIEKYAQGLQHRLAISRSALKVVLVKPGPTITPMTANLVTQGQRLASVDAVAHTIVQGAAKGHAVVYAPDKWRFIMRVIRCLPNTIFHKLNI